MYTDHLDNFHLELFRQKESIFITFISNYCSIVDKPRYKNHLAQIYSFKYKIEDNMLGIDVCDMASVVVYTKQSIYGNITEHVFQYQVCAHC